MVDTTMEQSQSNDKLTTVKSKSKNGKTMQHITHLDNAHERSIKNKEEEFIFQLEARSFYDELGYQQQSVKSDVPDHHNQVLPKI